LHGKDSGGAKENYTKEGGVGKRDEKKNKRKKEKKEKSQ